MEGRKWAWVRKEGMNFNDCIVVAVVVVIKMNIFARIALRTLKVFYSDVVEGGVAVDCEKGQFFLNTLYISLYSRKCSGSKTKFDVCVGWSKSLDHCFAFKIGKLMHKQNFPLVVASYANYSTQY